MKTLYPLLVAAPLLLGGCKLDLDTHSVDRYRLFAANGMILRLNTETGEIARVTETGITNLSDVSAIDNPPPDIKALLDKYASKPTAEKPASELKPGESTTQGLPPGWSVKRDN